MSGQHALQLALGVLLAYDSLERAWNTEDLYLLCGAHSSELLALILVVQCSIGLGLGLAGFFDMGSTATSVLAIAGYCASAGLYHIERRAYMAGDLLLRWLLLWLAVGPSRLASLGILVQCGLVYGVSLAHKCPSAYIFEGHAVRSLLLSEGFSCCHSRPFWRWAIALTFSPLGSTMSRTAWLAEAACALAAASAVASAASGYALAASAAPTSVRSRLRAAQSIALAAPVPLMLGIGLTANISFFPVVTTVLHVRAYDAIRNLRSSGSVHTTEADTAAESPRRRRAASALLMLTVALTLVELLPKRVSDRIVRTIALSQRWNMFPFAEAAPLVSGRVVTFVHGRRHGGGDGTFEVDLDTLFPRSDDDRLDFGLAAYHQRAALRSRHSFRWMLLETKLIELGTEAALTRAAQIACERAHRRARAGRLPGRPNRVEIFEVMYDLPRRRGAPTVPAELTKYNMSAAVPTHLGIDRATGLWGAWPRSVLAVGSIVWDCDAAAPSTTIEPVVLAFEEGRGDEHEEPRRGGESQPSDEL